MCRCPTTRVSEPVIVTQNAGYDSSSTQKPESILQREALSDSLRAPHQRQSSEMSSPLEIFGGEKTRRVSHTWHICSTLRHSLGLWPPRDLCLSGSNVRTLAYVVGLRLAAKHHKLLRSPGNPHSRDPSEEDPESDKHVSLLLLGLRLKQCYRMNSLETSGKFYGTAGQPPRSLSPIDGSPSFTSPVPCASLTLKDRQRSSKVIRISRNVNPHQTGNAKSPICFQNREVFPIGKLVFLGSIMSLDSTEPAAKLECLRSCQISPRTTLQLYSIQHIASKA